MEKGPHRAAPPLGQHENGVEKVPIGRLPDWEPKTSFEQWTYPC